MTKYTLVHRLFGSARDNELSSHWIDSQGGRHRGTLLSLQREDGSGNSFNVTIQCTALDPQADLAEPRQETFHVRVDD